MTSQDLGDKIPLNESHSSNLAWRPSYFYLSLDQSEFNFSRPHGNAAPFGANTKCLAATCAIDCGDNKKYSSSLQTDGSSLLCYCKVLSSSRGCRKTGRLVQQWWVAPLRFLEFSIYRTNRHDSAFGRVERALIRGGSGVRAAAIKYSQADTHVCLESLMGLQLLNVYLTFWRPSNNKSDWVYGAGSTSSLHTSSIARPSLFDQSGTLRLWQGAIAKKKTAAPPVPDSSSTGSRHLCAIFLRVDF